MENKLTNFEVLGKLGSGAYSSVYKVKRISDGQLYALKKVKLQDVGEREKQNALNEVRIIASIQHPNIVSYKECFFDTSNQSGTPDLCIIMEFAEDGDLLGRIQQQVNLQMYIPEKEIWNILGNALHDRKIFHRDLKCANVFMFADKKVKLGDFNVSKLAKKGLVYTQTGTPYYASPEVWQDKPYDHKADIWSLGCVIYETTSLKPPFRAKDMDGLYKAIMRGVFPPIPGIYSQELSSVIKMMLQVKPDLRPDCDKLLSLPMMQRRLEQQTFVKFVINQAQEDTAMNLLKTIKWPTFKKGLQQHKSEVIHVNLQLPGANYDLITPISQANTNHLKRHGLPQSTASNRIKSQENIDSTQSAQHQGHEQIQIQSILNQLGKLQKGKVALDAQKNIVNGRIKREPIQMYPDNKKNNNRGKKIFSEPNDSSRKHQVTNINISQISSEDADVFFDEFQEAKPKKISETVEARRGRVSNSQHDPTVRGSHSNEKMSKLQLDSHEIQNNYYVRDLLSQIGKQQHAQKLPVLYQHYSYSKQHGVSCGQIEEEEEYTHHRNKSLAVGEKKPLRQVLKIRQDRVVSLNKESSQILNVGERKSIVDDPLPKLMAQRLKN